MPVFAESRPDIGMNTYDLSLQVKERPSGVPSDHRTVGGNKLPVP